MKAMTTVNTKWSTNMKKLILATALVMGATTAIAEETDLAATLQLCSSLSDSAVRTYELRLGGMTRAEYLQMTAGGAPDAMKLATALSEYVYAKPLMRSESGIENMKRTIADEISNECLKARL